MKIVLGECGDGSQSLPAVAGLRKDLCVLQSIGTDFSPDVHLMDFFPLFVSAGRLWSFTCS